MGNCNFKAEKDKESVSGKNLDYLLNYFNSIIKESIPVSICHRKRRLWKSLEGGKEEREGDLRNEGDV